MGRLEQTQFHKVFLTEVEGHTLVVTPRGDAVGFRDSRTAACEAFQRPGLTGTAPGLVSAIGNFDLKGADVSGSEAEIDIEDAQKTPQQ